MLRTSYKLRAVDRPWIKQALSLPQSSVPDKIRPYGRGKSGSGGLLEMPLLTAGFKIRMNGVLTPRR